MKFLTLNVFMVPNMLLVPLTRFSFLNGYMYKTNKSAYEYLIFMLNMIMILKKIWIH